MDQRWKDAFWARIQRSDGCWLWVGYLDKKGYGRVALRKRLFFTHRVSWMLTYGEIPAGLYVCHHCDNPQCARPDHLFLGTNQENQIDAVRKGRRMSQAGERNGFSKLTEDKVKQIRDRYAQGVTQKQLAKEFCVSGATISHVVTGRSWRHVPGKAA